MLFRPPKGRRAKRERFLNVGIIEKTRPAGRVFSNACWGIRISDGYGGAEDSERLLWKLMSAAAKQAEQLRQIPVI